MLHVAHSCKGQVQGSPWHDIRCDLIIITMNDRQSLPVEGIGGYPFHNTLSLEAAPRALNHVPC